MLKALLEENLLDYVAMDIKNCPDRYAATCGGPDILTHVEECLDLLRKSPVEWELRTTCVKPFHDRDAMEAIGKWLRGTEHYYLQNFVDSGDLVGTGVSGFTKEEMEALCQAVLPYIPTTRIRGI
jgi:pyruvate formate lyase activating enzyme